MTNEELQMLRPFIDAAFAGDEEIVFYYDKGEPVKTIEDVCENIQEKIRVNYPEAKWDGLWWQAGNRIGYVVYENDQTTTSLLISFGVNKKYRTPEILKNVWEHIKGLCGEHFSCVLYSYNRRGIAWLEKCGMKKLVENVTILRLCQQEDC